MALQKTGFDSPAVHQDSSSLMEPSADRVVLDGGQ